MVNFRGWISRESRMAHNPQSSETVFYMALGFELVLVTDDGIIDSYAMYGVLYGSILRILVCGWDCRARIAVVLHIFYQFHRESMNCSCVEMA